MAPRPSRWQEHARDVARRPRRLRGFAEPGEKPGRGGMRGSTPACRFCGAALKHIVLDLGEQPLANSFLTEADLGRPEPRYRLCVRVCDDCLLVQTDTTVPPET